MIWITVGLLAVLALLIWACWYCYRVVFYNQNSPDAKPDIVPEGLVDQNAGKRILEMYREAQMIPYEQVYITSRDGLRLSGRLYCLRKDAPVLIRLHGYRSDALRDYAGGHRMGLEFGYNTLVVDQRAHGNSQGHTISFGIRERFDCLDWAYFIQRRFGSDVPIVLSGISMGAATVLMAADLELPCNVKGIIADCPYSSPGAIIQKVCRDDKIPAWLGYPFVVLGAFLFGRFCIWQSSPVKSVSRTRIPILLIHGEKDGFVPMEMSKEIYNACAGPKRIYTVAGAEHGLSCIVDSAGCAREIRDFLDDCGILSQ